MSRSFPNMFFFQFIIYTVWFIIFFNPFVRNFPTALHSSPDIQPIHDNPQAKQQPSVKVGLAAIQEMARLQEEALMRDSVSPPNLERLTDSDLIAESPPLLERLSSLERDNSNFPSADLSSLLRFDPEARCLKLEEYEFKSDKVKEGSLGIGNDKDVDNKGLAKFPLDVPTPVQSPSTGLKRFGSFRQEDPFGLICFCS